MELQKTMSFYKLYIWINQLQPESLTKITNKKINKILIIIRPN